ncbi:MAG: hypothetical protein B6229_09015 [Spirochaetaceae bacterium 4572_7]|nr:MAG: hypothetical protein B6229_09015 [Spirochaetaceae bacterium 4572_7]
MINIDNKDEMDRVIKEDEWALFYLSRPECGVCGSLLPKIKDISKKYEKLNTYYVDLNKDETISGQYSIFTIPAVVVFTNGKESIREARQISVGDIDSKLERIASLI